MSQIVSFAEESCWDGERFRSVRREIVFVVRGWQLPTIQGKQVLREFTADFGLWYDVDDELLIKILRDLEPSVRWDWYVYHKKLDHSAIVIHDSETGKSVGQISCRGGTKQKLSGEMYGANIVPIARGKDIRAARIKRESERAAKRGRETGGPDGC
jgi:hypothetical protein